MKHTFSILAAGLLATVSTAAMADPIAGPYVEVGAGTTHPLSFTAKGTGIPTGTGNNYKWGLAAEGALGYSFGDGLRTEFEFGYLSSKVNKYKGALAADSGGTLKQFDYMINGIYDFDMLGWPVIPHAGIGGGFNHTYQGSATPTAVNIEATRLALQGIIGAEFPIPGYTGLNLGVDYRYIETFNVKGGAGPGNATTFHGNLGAHNILLTLRYNFGAPAAPAPVPPMAQPAKPMAPPEAQRAFQVFFDFDKSVITAEAAATIQKAANTVKSGHVATINVTGHTDTVGSAKYNLALSQRRADSVKKQLLADGIPASEIATSGVGKSGLLVPTPDGVREPQNRRAEIVLQ